MNGLEGKYDYKNGILKKQGDELILELKYRQNISTKKPPRFLMQEKSSGKEYVSSLYPEGGIYIMNDRRHGKQTYVVTTGSTWAEIKKRK